MAVFLRVPWSDRALGVGDCSGGRLERNRKHLNLGTASDLMLVIGALALVVLEVLPDRTGSIHERSTRQGLLVLKPGDKLPLPFTGQPSWRAMKA